ncbi:MAG: DNA-3-methyladenine glycosylase I [Alphaproteobacteria bacterium]
MYCDYVYDHGHEHHLLYHDTEYGFPEMDDVKLFELLVLEFNQAGLSWSIILKKRENFRLAFKGFDPKVVAAFDDADRARLLNDKGIIRNKLKVNAVIYNAEQVCQIQETHGSFARWIAAHHPLSHAEWVTLFRKTFKFMGPEIVKEFLMSIGYLAGAHREDCPVYQQVLASKPPWAL